MTVDLTEAEWNAVLSMIAMGPWREANPVLMKIGEQLREQKVRTSVLTNAGDKLSAN